eukprot:317787_1
MSPMLNCLVLVVLIICCSLCICLYVQWRIELHTFSSFYMLWCIIINAIFNLIFYTLYATQSYAIFGNICCNIICPFWRKPNTCNIIKTSVQSQPLHIQCIYHLHKLTIAWLYVYLICGFLMSFGLFIWLSSFVNKLSWFDAYDTNTHTQNTGLELIPYLILLIPSFYPFLILCKIWKTLIPIIKPKLQQINNDIIKSYNNYNENEFEFMFNVFALIIKDIKYVLFFSKLYAIITLFIIPLLGTADAIIIFAFIRSKFGFTKNYQFTITLILNIIIVCLFIFGIFSVITLWNKSHQISNIVSKYLNIYDNFKNDKNMHIRRSSYMTNTKTSIQCRDETININDNYFKKTDNTHLQSGLLNFDDLDIDFVFSFQCKCKCCNCKALTTHVLYHKLQLIMKYLLKYWRRHSFWVQNLILIMSCSITCICVGIEVNKLFFAKDAKMTVNDIIIVTLLISFIISISVCGVCLSVITVFLEYFGKHKIKQWYSSDKDFRGMCLIKTVLFQIKQPLIWYFNHSVWSYVFRVLSFLTLLTIAYLTYNNKFIKLSILPIKYPKLFMFGYIISYVLTNLCSSLIVIIGILFTQNGEIYEHNQYINWFNIVYLPFLWLYVTKLFNNEMSILISLLKPKNVKFKLRTISNNDHSNRYELTSITLQIQSCLGNIYNFAFQTVFQCIVTITIYLFLIKRIISHESQWILTQFYYVQITITFVILTNSILTIFAM